MLRTAFARAAVPMAVLTIMTVMRFAITITTAATVAVTITVLAAGLIAAAITTLQTRLSTLLGGLGCFCRGIFLKQIRKQALQDAFAGFFLGRGRWWGRQRLVSHDVFDRWFLVAF
jgi:hypothetical protein